MVPDRSQENTGLEDMNFASHAQGSEEEFIETTQESDGTEDVVQLPEDPVVDTGLEGGALPSTSQSEEPFSDSPAQTEVKPGIWLS